jgi:hypothetical protein
MEGRTMPASLNTYRTIAVVVSALGLLSACGLGGSTSYQPPPSPTPPELITLSSQRLFFEAALGSASAPQTFTVTNVSNVTVGMRPAEMHPVPNTALPYTFETTCGSYLAAAASCTYTVVFRPAPGKINTADIWLDIQADQRRTVLLRGTVEETSTAPAGTKR